MAWWIGVREYASFQAIARGEAPLKHYDATDERTGEVRKWDDKSKAERCKENWDAVEHRPFVYRVI